MPMLGTKLMWPLMCFGDQWPELPFLGRPFQVIEMGIHDIKWIEPRPLVYSLKAPVNKHLVQRPGEGWVLFIRARVTLGAYDATWTAGKKFPFGICLKWTDLRTQDWSLCLEKRLHFTPFWWMHIREWHLSAERWAEEEKWWWSLHPNKVDIVGQI